MKLMNDYDPHVVDGPAHHERDAARLPPHLLAAAQSGHRPRDHRPAAQGLAAVGDEDHQDQVRLGLLLLRQRRGARAPPARRTSARGSRSIHARASTTTTSACATASPSSARRTRTTPSRTASKRRTGSSKRSSTYAHAHAVEDPDAHRQRPTAGSSSGSRLALRAALERAPGTGRDPDGRSRPRRSTPIDGHLMDRRVDVRKPERMPEYGTFKATETERVPSIYYVPAALTKAIDHLRGARRPDRRR